MLYNINGGNCSTVYDVNGRLLTQAYDVNGQPKLGGGTSFKVMTYNVGQWYIGNNNNVPTSQYSTFYALQRAIMADNDVDLAAFQEYYNPFSAGHSVSSVIGEYFEYSDANATSGYIAKAIFTKDTAISNFENVNFTHGSSQSYLKCKINVDGKDIWVINAHLATSNAETNKVAQAKELFDYISTLDYFILLGDFNTVCKSTSDTEYTTIMKQFVDAGFNSANCSAQHGFIDTWTSGTSISDTWYPCDQIITSANITINNVAIDQHKIVADTGLSIDHVPLIAELTIY